ncbi:DUF4251 domain-containing protein [Nonlabens sp.]|uniref:DUF4251 domain-containing protein n=1 Tax=Nonlabens sp. TaxID=1888209 RepID=UPI003F69FAF6
MKTYQYSLILILTLVLTACKSSFTEEDRDKLATLQTQMSEGSFEFKATTVKPFNTQALNNVANELLLRTGNSAARINVQGENYTMKIEEEQVVFSLPFYGERRMGGGYNNDTGYSFTGDLTNLTSIINEKEKCIVYEFSTYHKSESLDVELKVFSPNSAQLHINSSHRTFIKYDGNIKWLQKI